GEGGGREVREEVGGGEEGGGGERAPDRRADPIGRRSDLPHSSRQQERHAQPAPHDTGVAEAGVKPRRLSPSGRARRRDRGAPSSPRARGRPTGRGGRAT